jgi:small-conductance mechanosensitive channel
VVLFLRWVALVPPTGLAVRLTESLWLAATISAIIGIINNVVFESAQPASWQHKVPRLLRDLIRLLLVAIGLAMVYSFVWGREIENALAALGVTSIVVGLALQEPLGTLFRPDALMERPFRSARPSKWAAWPERSERSTGGRRTSRRSAGQSWSSPIRH